MAVGLAVVDLAMRGEFAAIEARFAPRLRVALPAGGLRKAWETEIGVIGAELRRGEPTAEDIAPGLVRVRVPLTGRHGGLTVLMGIDAEGALQGLRLDGAGGGGSAWAAPAYADPGRFEEREVVLDAGLGPVTGVLTLPRVGAEAAPSASAASAPSAATAGPAPGVVLLSGAGPFDRDGTAGPLKPLKDLAWGLASRGVASLRFDKVTGVHADRVAATPGFTLADEYVPHAVAAVRALQGAPGVDPARVFVLGHSAGGKVAPRVAAAEPSVAGLVLFAADAAPMNHAAVRVFRHIAALTPGLGAEAEAAIAELERQAARVDSPDLAADTPGAELPLGLSGAYWLDLRGYDPVATLAALDMPALLLQGGRDYQVTVADDLALWRAGLDGRPGVTVSVHERADHLFFMGDGPATPADYAVPGHVDGGVVAEIAEWITAQRL
ncbi:alpha/beta hydrolase [Streptacidiphilus sp. NEAU-YB345]|uniref:Alpha/beta hydrolase n=2 Tax=Streptacidiphilus fuscans TaxID=2789292 RepID=A0A931B1N4_9ACTN|nr:alpha/beta hydrolase [Streptacidiphilus fuscans]